MSNDYLGKLSASPYLTAYATGIIEDDLPKLAGLADVLAPRVPVLGKTFRHAVYDAKSQLQIPPDTKRPLGGAAKRIVYSQDQTERTLDTHGLDVVIDDMERVNAENSQALALEKQKIKTLMRAALAAHVTRCVALYASTTAATGGVWTTMTNDPVAEIDTAIEEIQLLCGSMPNQIVMGLAAWRKFRANTLTISRLKGTVGPGAIKPDDTVGMFINPSARVTIAESLYDSAALGLAASLARFVGSTAFIIYNNPSPVENDASHSKTFYNAGTGLIQIGAPYREPQTRSDVYPTDWHALSVVTNSVAAKKFTVT